MSGKAWLMNEPNIEEVLGDPIVRLLMRRDGVSEDSLREAIGDALGGAGDLDPGPEPEPKVA